MKAMILWEWDSIGFSFLLYKNMNFYNYKWSFDIQILWFNLWIVFYKRTEKEKEKEEKHLNPGTIHIDTDSNTVTISTEDKDKVDWSSLENSDLDKPLKTWKD